MSDEEVAEEVREQFELIKDLPANTPSDANPIIGWAVRGFVGAATLLLRLAKSGIPMPEHWKEVALKAAEEIIHGVRNGD